MSALNEDKIDKVERVDAKGKSSLIEAPEAEERVAPNKDHFDSLIGTPETEVTAGRKVDSSKVPLSEEIANIGRRADAVSRSPQDLVAQAQEVVSKINELKDKLNTPNLELKTSTQNALQNRLSHIDEGLKIALTKAGIEYKEPVAATTASTPIERFLGFLTDGQQKLESLATDAQTMALNRQELNPATMLLLQIKVGYIQQELEFFTATLNKALESTKTLMNVQV